MSHRSDFTPKLAFVVACLVNTQQARATPTADPDAPNVVDARLRELPTSKACRERKHTWVETLYRVERVRRGTLRPHDEVIVVHACPRRDRGFSSKSRGNAGRLRPGQRHGLTLVPWNSERHPHVTLQREGLRYRALRTDRAEARPIIVITLKGGPGVYRRLEVEGSEATIGKAALCSFAVADERLKAVHLRLKVERGERLAIYPASQTEMTINGKPATPGQNVTHTDRIELFDYDLRVSLLTAKWFRQTGRRR